MSYILDALQRSERDRRRADAPSIHSPLSIPNTPARRVWPWVAAAILIFNISVLGLWSYRERVAPAPVAEEIMSVAPEKHTVKASVPTPPSPQRRSVNSAVLEIAELPTRIQEALPALHISAHIHVVGKPASGFVIINGLKLREGQEQDQLRVDQIRRTELVLSYLGHRFRWPIDLE